MKHKIFTKAFRYFLHYREIAGALIQMEAITAERNGTCILEETSYGSFRKAVVCQAGTWASLGWHLFWCHCPDNDYHWPNAKKTRLQKSRKNPLTEVQTDCWVKKYVQYPHKAVLRRDMKSFKVLRQKKEHGWWISFSIPLELEDLLWCEQSMLEMSNFI